MEYPVDYITYLKNGEILDYVNTSMKNTLKKGFVILPLTPDEFTNKPHHCGFKHIKEITIPKIKSVRSKIKGFFIAEGDLDIYENYDFETFKQNIPHKPTWLGYKKKLCNYIVGNFLIYFPIEYFDELELYIKEQKRLVYSDRFFSKLYFEGFLKLNDKSIAGELVHHSNIINDIRY